MSLEDLLASATGGSDTNHATLSSQLQDASSFHSFVAEIENQNSSGAYKGDAKTFARLYIASIVLKTSNENLTLATHIMSDRNLISMGDIAYSYYSIFPGGYSLDKEPLSDWQTKIYDLEP